MILNTTRCRFEGEMFPYRSNSRFFNVQGLWYFTTREGVLGPYRTRSEAEMEAMLFIRQIQASDCFGVECEHRVAC